MMTETQVHIYDMRLSFIWTETFLHLLSDPMLPGAPMAFLGRRSSYAQRFEQVLHSRPAPGNLEPPWPKTGKHFFWTYYLKGRPPTYVSGNKAWNALVPFRVAVPTTIKAPDEPWRFVLEAFLYPHGLGLVVTATYHDTITLQEMVEKARQIQREDGLNVKWDDGDHSESLNLGAFADKGRAVLRKAALGPGIVSDVFPSPKPFTVFTVVRGAGVDPATKTPNGGDVHRALEAITTWSPDWQTAQLPDLADLSVNLHIREESAAGSVLYGRERGRAVWFPGLFTLEPGTSQHSLACYHRNLVLVSLQVESMAGLVVQTAEQIEKTSLSEPHSDCARHAAAVLGQLYRGTPSTYRSWSPRTQIEQNNYMADLNKVRDLFGMIPLM
jgi:hypothetical protein